MTYFAEYARGRFSVRRVFVYSFVFIVATSLASWLMLPEEASWISYPIIYFSYMIFNKGYGRWAVRDAPTITSPDLWAGFK
ncbi:MAG: hypothetical protein WC941_00805 [Candidatus Bathyarchaeia archaeon]